MMQDYIHGKIFHLVSISAIATTRADLGKDNELPFDKAPAKCGVGCSSGKQKKMSFINDIVLLPSV